MLLRALRLPNFETVPVPSGLPHRACPRILGAVSVVAALFASHASLALAAPDAGKATAAAGTSDATRRGIVQVEVSGRPRAVGIVLGHDGRILSAASALGEATTFGIRYADGTVVDARVGQLDRAWDLALLVPESGTWTEGLSASIRPAEASAVGTYLPKSGPLSAVKIDVKGPADVQSVDGEVLRGALDVDFKGLPKVLGGPLLDPEGKVVGVLVRACKMPSPQGSGGAAAAPPTDPGSAPCPVQIVAAPIHAVRRFLVTTMKAPPTAAPWLGLGGVASSSPQVHGVRVLGVAPGSPAERAGIAAAPTSSEGAKPPKGDAAKLAGDTVVAIDGAPIETPEQLAAIVAKHAVGDSVKLLLVRAGKFREVAVVLDAVPPSPPAAAE